MARKLTHDMTSEGFALFDERGNKVAIVGCVTEGEKIFRIDPATGKTLTDNQGHPQASLTFKPLPRTSWGVHFTSPSVNLELLEAVLAAIPKGDDHTQHDTERKAH